MPRTLWPRRLGFTGLTLGGCLVADWWINRRGPLRREFLRLSPEVTVMENLVTGDVLLINRSLIQPHPLKLLAVLLSKQMNDSEFDHIGVVIRDRESDLPYVLEHGFQGPQLTPYDERLLHSRDSIIGLRQLLLVPTQEAIETAEALAEDAVEAGGIGLIGQVLLLIRAAVDGTVPSAQNRSRVEGAAAVCHLMQQKEHLHNVLVYPGYLASLPEQQRNRKNRTYRNVELTLLDAMGALRKRSDFHSRGPDSPWWQTVSPAAELTVRILQTLEALPSGKTVSDASQPTTHTQLQSTLPSGQHAPDSTQHTEKHTPDRTQTTTNEPSLSSLDDSPKTLTDLLNRECPNANEYLPRHFLPESRLPLPVAMTDPEGKKAARMRKEDTVREAVREADDEDEDLTELVDKLMEHHKPLELFSTMCYLNSTANPADYDEFDMGDS